MAFKGPQWCICGHRSLEHHINACTYQYEQCAECTCLGYVNRDATRPTQPQQPRSKQPVSTSYDEEINAFLKGSGGRSAFKDAGVGAVVSGEIIDLKMADVTDPKTDEIKRFKDGNPMRQLVVSLQTDERDGPDDDGIRRVYARGGKWDIKEGAGLSARDALNDALAKVGAERLEIGGRLTVKRSGIGVPKERGTNAPWLYQAKYEAPVKGVSLAEEDAW